MVDTLPQDTELFLSLLFDPDDDVTIAQRGPGDNKTAEWLGYEISKKYSQILYLIQIPTLYNLSSQPY
jgi:hypothetical protein